MNGQELELFRVGDYGDKGSYTDADLQDLVTRYSSGAHDEAAITVGHPTSDSEPAYGWLKSLRFAGGTLFGTPGEVNPDFDSAVVDKKAYKHRSVGFSRSQDGKLTLRHVAFLGAVPPAIKGLKVASFSSEPYQEFAFSEGDDMPNEQELEQSIMEGIKSFFSEMFTPKSTPTAADTEALAARIEEKIAAKFSSDLEVERTARKAVETKLAAQEKQFSESGAKGKVAVAIAGLKSAGVWIPAYDKIGVPELFAELAASEATITFSEPDPADKTKTVEVKRDLVAAFSGVLKSVGQIVPAGRMTPKATTEFSSAAPQGNGADIDTDSIARDAVVRKFANDNKVSYTDAYAAVVSQGKMPQPGASAAGSV